MALILVISGPAGVGKTTICSKLLKEFKNSLSRVITTTTRPPRNDEVDGIDYNFMDEAEFKIKLERGSFLEYEIIHGNFYGTQKSSVMNLLKSSKNILLNIDVKGAKSLRKEICENADYDGIYKSIFLKPENIDVLKNRLLQRGSDNEQSITSRLETAKSELILAEEFDHVVISADKIKDYNSVREIYLCYK